MASEFPYKTINLCYRCYRIIKGRNIQKPVNSKRPSYSPQMHNLQSDAVDSLGNNPVTVKMTRNPGAEEVFYYLRRRTNERKPLEFRYKSAKLNSDKKWRVMSQFDFNREYFWDLSTQPSYKYRIDRVVEYKE